MDGAPQKLVGGGSPSFWSRAYILVRRRSAGIGNADMAAAEAEFNHGGRIGKGCGISNIHRLREDCAATDFFG